VQNWAEVIERELLVLEEVVRNVEESVEEQEGGVGGHGDRDRDGGGGSSGEQRSGDAVGRGNGESNGWLRWW